MPQLIDYPRYAIQLLAGQRSSGERSQYERTLRDIAPYIDMGQLRDVLDVANGRLRPQYALMRAAGHRVIGVDFVNRPSSSMTDRAYALAREVYGWRLGIPRSAMGADRLLVSDVGRLPFPDGSFDLAISAAAFEHFLDIPAVVAEIYRVLRPGGMIWVSIHLFTSPTGGHNIAFTEFPVKTLPKGVDAWDHLRKRHLPFTVPLNEWRQHQYMITFREHFEVVNSYCAGREGQGWLTPELHAELAGYSVDELTCAALVIVARKAR